MVAIKTGSKPVTRTEKSSRAEGEGAAKTIQLLLIDDHKIALDAFRSYVSAQTNFEVSTLLNDEIKLARKLKRTAPVIVVNMRMQNPDGVTAVKLLLSALPNAKVIGFGNLENRESVLSMLRAGACGFVSHNSSLAELFRAVRTVSRGEGFLCPSISKLIVEEFKRGGRSATPDESLKLTEHERRMLVLIADGRSNKEMAGALAISVRTIEKYRETLMSKLHINTIAGLTKFAIRAGIARLD